MADVSVVIDIGSARVRAVCRYASGTTMPLLIEGAAALPALVYIDDTDGLVTGAEGIRRGRAHPQRLVTDPLTGLAGAPMEIDGRSIDPVDLVAALIGRCAAEARAACATTDLTLVLAAPAGWGPRRRPLLHAAAQRAGFADVELVAAPVAAAVFATRVAGVSVPVDALVVVCDIDPIVTSASVLHRRGDADWDPLSSVTRPLSASADKQTAPPVRTIVAGAGFDRHLGEPLVDDQADGLPENGIVAATTLVASAAQAVVEAIDGADVDPAAVSTVLVVGDLPVASGLDKAVAELTGLTVAAPIRADEATVLGAATLTATEVAHVWRGGWAPIPAPELRWTQVTAAAVAGFGSLLLLAHTLATVYKHQVGIYVDYVQVNTGEFVLACLLAMVTAMTIARGLVLGRIAFLAENQRPEQTTLPQQILGSAAALGITVSVVYALLLAIVAGQPAGHYLGTAMVAVAPVTVFVALIVAILPRLQYLGGNALRQLQQQVTPIALAAGGVALVVWAYNQPAGTTTDLVARAGSAMVGAACALQLTRRLVPRLVAVPLAGLIATLATSVSTENVYGYAFVVCVQVWWLWQTAAIIADGFPRLWSRARRRPPQPLVLTPTLPSAPPSAVSAMAPQDGPVTAAPRPADPGPSADPQEAAHGPGK